MADKKELPVNGGLFFPSYGLANLVANANGSQASSSSSSSSSNFNPLLANAASVGFNPMASGYPGAATSAAAFYSSPFSMLPFAVAANAANTPNSMSFLGMPSHGPSSMLSSGFPPQTNPMWPGLMPPDYLLNIAALQSLQQQPVHHHHHPNVILDSGETFNDVLKKMPKATTMANSNVDERNNHRIFATSTSSTSHERIPSSSTTAAVSNSSSSHAKNVPSSSAASSSSTVIKHSSAVDSIPRASSSTASSFSATSLAISDQKLASPSSCSSGRESSSSNRQQHQQQQQQQRHQHHSSSLATLAEIASSLQSNDRKESGSSKRSGEHSVKKEAKNLNSTNKSSSSTAMSNDRSKPARNGTETKPPPPLNVDRSSKPSVTNANGASTVESSRKRPSSKISNSTTEQQHGGAIVRKKEPKLEHHAATHSVQPSTNSKSTASKSDEKDHRRNRQEDNPSSSAAAAAAAALFGASLSSDLKMDPNLLNASAMAWAALSNQWLFANVQNELMNRATASLQHQQQQQQQSIATNSSTKSGSNSRQQNSIKSPDCSAESSGSSATTVKKSKDQSNDQQQQHDQSRRNSRGRQSTVSSQDRPASIAEKKDHVDVTIDAVIKQQQNAMAGASSKSSSRRKSTPTDGTKRGRGSRGGITVREQLAARRGTKSSSTESSTISAKSGDTSSANGSKERAVEKNGTSSSDAAPQTMALDLSVKSSSQTPVLSAKGSDGSSMDSATHAVGNGFPEASSSDDVEDSNTVGAALKKRRIAEADAVRSPLMKGWRRQTYVRGISSNCIRGDVIYYAPCGKRLGSYSEVVRYLSKHDIRDIDRDNFSFSSKVLVGEFMHVRSDGGKNKIVKMTEKELRDMLSKMRTSTVREVLAGERKSNNGGAAERRFADRSRRRGFSSIRRNASRNSNAIRFGEARKKDVAGQPGEQNRQGWESKRLERERDTQVIEHERKRKLDLMRNQKVMEAMQRAKEKEIRQQNAESMKKQEGQYMQQMAILANMEREKVRQQMLFSRALEARRRQEEKERLYAEKLIRREERLAARTATLMKLRQQRQPVEDMEIEDSKELPNLNRLENMTLDGQSFADLLMVMEFIKNFGHVLKIDKAEVPSIDEVHAGLLNDRRHVNSLRNLVKTLLLLVMEYPGLPVGNGGRTLLGQPAKDVGVTDMNMSELLRLFLLSRDEQGKQLGNEMNNLPYEALSPSRKAAILAYMCNELLYCRNVVREIEGNIDVIAKVKSDRWALESKVRHMKVVQASKRKVVKAEEGQPKEGDDGEETTATSNNSTIEKSCDVVSKHEDDEDEGDSSDSEGKPDKDSDTKKKMPKTLFGITAGEIESISKEEKLMSVEEVDKELERLRKEMHDVRSRVHEVSVRVRAFPFGQDRYSRYYWILPHHSGVFVEGVESAGANNPAVKYTSPILSSPSSSARSSSPTKFNDDVRSCVHDLIEAVAVTNSTDEETDLESAYSAAKMQRTSGAETSVESTPKLATSAKGGLLKGGGIKKMKPVPLDMQDGWWWINDPQQLDTIPPQLFHRGIREKQLNRTLTKCGDHVKRAAFQAGKQIIKFDPVDVPDECEPSVMTLRSARRLLNMTRQLEEKVFQANVHVKGWKPTDNVPDTSPSETVDSGSSDNSCDSVLDIQDKFASHKTDELLGVVKDRLLQLELSIERRYFMPAFNREDANLVASSSTNTPETDDNGQVVDLSSASELRRSTSDDPEGGEGGDADDDVPLALERWRGGVGKASNIAQLSMCLEELDAQVAWDKSVMKASCQICRGGDNESQLLLCDGCDFGYHTYCFKPKLDTVPEGDWFCPECVQKATRRPCCLLCCRQASRPMIACTECSRNFHLDCLPGPVKKTRNGAWTCGGCSNGKGGQPKSVKSMPSAVDSQVIPIAPVQEVTPPKKRSQPKKTPPLKNGARPTPAAAEPSSPLKFHELCSIILAELDAHKDAIPFRTPVDTKGCPLYKKVIKQPMDMSTIQTKLTGKKYDNEQQFVTDVKLMFDNCRTFNEDDSAIGKSGHALRRFFNKRWKELKESNGKKP